MDIVGIKIVETSAVSDAGALVIQSALSTDGGNLEKVGDNLTDAVLAARAAGGEEDAFEEILRRYGPRVFRVCGKFFVRYSLVEEAAQETFLKAFTQLKNFEGRGSLEGWLTRVAATTCINILRSQKRRSEITMSDLTESEGEWIENALSMNAPRIRSDDEQRLIASDLVDKVIGSLLPDDAMVLKMMECDGATIREAAELTGWTESKVKVRAFRARRKLREAVERLITR
jgi:RNA polymerase sigma-70 factor (ECF subfamily)